METVLSFKNVTLDKLSESSAQELEKKVRWNKWGQKFS